MAHSEITIKGVTTIENLRQLGPLDKTACLKPG